MRKLYPHVGSITKQDAGARASGKLPLQDNFRKGPGDEAVKDSLVNQPITLLVHKTTKMIIIQPFGLFFF